MIQLLLRKKFLERLNFPKVYIPITSQYADKSMLLGFCICKRIDILLSRSTPIPYASTTFGVAYMLPFTIGNGRLTSTSVTDGNTTIPQSCLSANQKVIQATVINGNLPGKNPACFYGYLRCCCIFYISPSYSYTVVRPTTTIVF